jgi:phosphoadenosine phosphosulfate reductase
LVSELEQFRSEIGTKSSADLLRWSVNRFAAGVVLASSLGAEDQVLTHLISTEKLRIEVFTLDTGRLFQESYDLIDVVRERLQIRIQLYFPDAGAVETMVGEKGPNLFYESVENRKRCCHVRKVEPLKRALSGRSLWITGQRREQSPTRSDLEVLEWDETNGLYKLNPLADWSHEQVWDYIRSNDVPYNKLHDNGFPSIGCAPCTRAVVDGEDPRAGRWWWESPEHKECGIHLPGEKKAVVDFAAVRPEPSGH